MSDFISPHLSKLLKVLTGLSLTNAAPEVANRLSICINHVAALPSRVVLTEISKVFGELNPENIPTLLSLTDKHIDHMERGAATKHQGLLQKFFLGALKFRHDNPSVERSLANSIENSTCVALVRLALKLPEASLRPLLFKIFSWGTDEDNLLCLLPLFTLYGHLAAALKSMFPIFTGSLSTYFVKILVRFLGFFCLIEVFNQNFSRKSRMKNQKFRTLEKIVVMCLSAF